MHVATRQALILVRFSVAGARVWAKPLCPAEGSRHSVGSDASATLWPKHTFFFVSVSLTIRESAIFGEIVSVLENAHDAHERAKERALRSAGPWYRFVPQTVYFPRATGTACCYYWTF